MMKSNEMVMKDKIQRLLIVAAIALILFFVLFQFVYIGGVFLGALGGVLLGVVTLIRTLSLFESFVSAAGFIIFLLMMAIVTLVRNAIVRSISFNIGFVFLAIGIFEAYLYAQQNNYSFAISLN